MKTQAAIAATVIVSFIAVYTLVISSVGILLASIA